VKAFLFSAARWVAPFLVVTSFAAASQAQPSGQRADPGNPLAAEPSVPYRSVFNSPQAGAAQERADWKKANAEVGQFPRGHADILKWEARQAPPSPTPVTPTAPARHHH
jgi:hypothetical protein